MLTPAEFWDREAIAPIAPPTHHWMANINVRHYINRLVSGEPSKWPLDWFQEAYSHRSFGRVLSIGCGSGALERDLIRRGLAESVDAFDASEESLRIARELAAAESMAPRIHYFTADFNTITLEPQKYDLVCFHQSLHHVSRLEHLLGQVFRTLKPEGLVYLDEFIGPSRDYWNAQTTRWYQCLYQLLPRSKRFFDDFALPVQHEDPSEAIRSSEIYSSLSIGFQVEQFRGYGGNILAMLFPDLRVDLLTEEEVNILIRADEAMLQAGATPFHAILVAKPRTGLVARFGARLRYAVEPRFPKTAGDLRAVKRRLRDRRSGLPFTPAP